MSRYITILLLVLLLAPVMTFAGSCGDGCGCAGCADGLKINGDFRWRAEADGKDFDKDTDMYTYSSMRARLGVKFKSGDIAGYMQLQYPYLLGRNSSVLSDDNASVHQAYLSVKNLFCNLSMKVGRFEMAYGDERLIGSVGWSNVGRTFEGIKFGYGMKEMFWANLFFTRLNNPAMAIKKNDLFVGLWAGLPMLNDLNVFYLHNRDAGQNPGGDWVTEMSRSTMGIHYWSMYEEMGLATLVDFAYQMGTNYDLSMSPYGEQTIAAWMAVVSLGYKIPIDLNLWVGAGFDMTSGDDPGTPDDYEGFSNLYYTGHKWRGYMDYFVADQAAGLTDIFINAIITPPIMNSSCKFELEYHLYSTNQDYDVMDASGTATGAKSTSIGSEINILRKQQLKENLVWTMGLGYFMPHEDWRADADGSMWLFCQLQAKFDHSIDK